jgi:hypothetical protein
MIDDDDNNYNTYDNYKEGERVLMVTMMLEICE